MSWNKRSQKCSICIKSLFFKNSLHKFVYIPVSEHFSFAKTIHPPDRCGISRIWSNSMIITQVHLVLGTMKGNSKCSVLSHDTDVSSWGSVKLVCWLQECPPVLLPENVMWISPTSFNGSMSNRPHNRRPHVWPHAGKRFADVNVVNRVPHGDGAVMVRASIIYGQQTQLHFIDGNLNARTYRDRSIVMPFICHHYLKFQHDNEHVTPWPEHSLFSLYILVWSGCDEGGMCVFVSSRVFVLSRGFVDLWGCFHLGV
jgi:hypothetical protein